MIVFKFGRSPVRHFVPDGIDVRTGTADVTGRLCVIGSHLNEDAIKELFGV